MKTPLLFAVPVVLLSAAVSAQDGAKEKSTAVLDTDMAKISYAIGMKIGGDLKKAGLDLDMAAFSAAIEDMLKDREPAMNQEQIGQAQQLLGEQLAAKRAAQQEKGKAEGAEFLKTNGARPEVKTTASGLQYEVLTEGTGPMPKATDTVSVHYKGSLLDGTVFDSSYDRGEPANFKVNGLIPGWVEALQLMKVGSKYKLYIPSELGYGERGVGEIPPNATLVFEMELLEIKAPEKPAEGDAQTITIQ
ncbi:MAG TPA: FKBP-type peptidyl-prolyl cis-trans isomerase [Candidatus Hydrogenedentes bacterium]|nr:FKBP-type peptidyl-prolyl cis-trans isomerase [Candidatus Hydrogenedentota bacterium]